jgi:putative iron-regulated protein
MRSARPLAPAVITLTLLLAACQSGNQAAAASSRQVADAFVSKVALPETTQLAQRSWRLADALDALAAEPGDPQLEQARRAWREARATWETGESWAFGPAETGGFDAKLNDWPVNGKDLRAAQASVRGSHP